MNPIRFLNRQCRRLLAPALFSCLLFSTANAWWDNQWSQRKELTLSVDGTNINLTEALSEVPVLVRLHIGNFNFSAAREDGADLRFIAADDQSALPYHIAQYDPMIGEAFVWVQAPSVSSGQPQSLHLYYGNPAAAAVSNQAATYDADTRLVYHFNERGEPARDASGNNNNAANAGLPVDGSLIGMGVQFDGKRSIEIPASESLRVKGNSAWTYSLWLKPALETQSAILYTRSDNGNGLQILLQEGAPVVRITNNGASVQTAAATPLPQNAWSHLALSAQEGEVNVFVNGEPYATLAASLPALNSPAYLGGEANGTDGFAGDIVEFNIAAAARSADYLRFATLTQAGEVTLLTIGNDELAGGGAGGLAEAIEHMMLFGDIANNMMFDGWIAVFVCLIMIIIGWSVAIRKFNYLNRIQKGTEAFLAQWREVSSDLTALDHGCENSVKTMGGKLDDSTQKLIEETPLYHIYHIGSEEIRNRLNSKQGFNGLSSRSMLTIKSKLESGLAREVSRLNRGLIYLTISIAGGPYVGLLGTVVGVMITFAVIAKTGEVEVNSIAPGIASALLATVAGLIVAIPALFIYSYLNSRIKEMITNMRTFIEEFVTSMGEFYPTPADRAGAGENKFEKKED